MSIKARGNGRFDVELRGRHVKRVSTRRTAELLESSGKRLLELGQPLEVVIAGLRGDSLDKPSPRLSDFHEAWSLHQSVLPASRIAYEQAWKRVAPIVGRTRLEDIDAAALRHLVVQMESTGFAPNSIKQSVTLVRTMLNDAYEDGLLVARPPARVKNMPRQGATVRPGRAITREEHEAMVAAAKPPYRLMFDLWWHVGLRRGEMLGLQRSDVDLAHRRLHVRRQYTPRCELTTPKCDSARHVELSTEAVRILATQMEVVSTSVLFPSGKGTHIMPSTLTSAVKATADRAGVEGMHSHLWRHTFGSRLLANGAPITYVAARMGDTESTLLRVYAHEIAIAEQRAADLLDEWLGEGTQRGQVADDFGGWAI